MKVTTEQVIEFAQTAQAWIAKHEPESVVTQDYKTKFGYALHRVLTQAQKVIQEYRDEVEDLDIAHCLTDDKDVIVRDERNQLKYTKEAMKLRVAAIRRLLTREVEIKPHISPSVPDGPDGLTFAEKDKFTGFVLREEEAETEESTVAA